MISAKFRAVFEERNSPFKFGATSAKIQAVFEERNSPFKSKSNIINAKIQAVFKLVYTNKRGKFSNIYNNFINFKYK